MDTLNAILSRRSVRQYKDMPIDKETLIELIKFGMYAPSACNKQPWNFIVIDNRNILDKIIAFQPNAAMLKNAACAIVVVGDELKAHDKGYWPVDCGAATQNILLAAHAKGLGACWIGIYPRQERIDAMKNLLSLPPHLHTFSVISLGYPLKNTPAMPERFDASRIFFNEFGTK